MAYFDNLDQNLLGELFKPAPAQPTPSRGALRGLGDLGAEAVSGVARGVKFTADAFGADNAVSRGASYVDELARGLLSAQAQGEDKQIAAIMAEAEDKGVWDQVVAAAKAFAVAPGRTAVNALGTSAPTIAAAFIPGVGQAGTAARLGAMGTMGAAQGAGVVKGSIYDSVRKAYEESGATPEDAAAAADAAQAYGGPNADSIGGGSVLGAAASMTGAQPIIARALGRKVAESAVTPGIARGVGRGILTEAPLEATQGGQEQLATNIALQREGADVPTWRGVAGSAALEGMAAAPIGGIAGGYEGATAKRQPSVNDLQIEQSNIALADIGKAASVDEAIQSFQQAVSVPLVEDVIGADGEVIPPTAPPRRRNAPLMDEIRQLPEADQQEAIGLVATMRSPKASPSVRRYAQNRLDELLLPVRQIPVGEVIEDDALPVGETQELTPTEANAQIAQEPTMAQKMAMGKRVPTGEATDLEADVFDLESIPEPDVLEVGDEQADRREPRTGRVEPVLIDPQAPNAVAQYVQRMRGVGTPSARAFVQDFEAGRITPQDVLELLVPNKREPTADERLQKAAAQAPKQGDGLLLTTDGMPYGTRSAAYVRAKKEGGSVIEVPGGWAVRKDTNEQPDLAGTATGSVGVGDAGRSDAGRGGAPVGRVAADPGRGGEGVATGAATSSGAPVAVGPELPADPALRVKELNKRWADAVGRGDMQAAVRINDQIVAAKQEAKAAQEAGARAADPASAPAAVPAAGPAPVEVGGVADSFEHAGLKVYKTKIRSNGAIEDRWAVQLPENRDTGNVGGDTLHKTPEEARKAAEQEMRRFERSQRDKAEIEAAETAAREAAATRKAQNAGKSIADIRRDAALDRQTSENGEVMTRRQWVERKVSEGLEPKITQEDKIKPMSRAQFNRATNEEQRAHDKRAREAGKKDVYWIGDYEVTKSEHDYAASLQAKAPTPQPEVNAEPAAEPVAEAQPKEPTDVERVIAMQARSGREPLSDEDTDLLRRVVEAQAAEGLAGLERGATFADAGITFGEDGDQSTILRDGVKVGTFVGKRTRETVMSVLRGNVQPTEDQDSQAQAGTPAQGAETTRPTPAPSVNVDRSPAPTNPPAAPQQTRPERLIELRKRASVLKSLLECLG